MEQTMQAGHGLLHCSRPGAAYTVKGVQTLETPCLHNTRPHRHYSYQYTDSGVEGAVVPQNVCVQIQNTVTC